MGVFGLHSLMKTDKNLYQKVDIAEIARNYNNETGNDPHLLVDISSCCKFLAGKDYSDTVSVSLRLLKENLETFVNNCYNIGIKVIIVGEGMKPPAKYERYFKSYFKKTKPWYRYKEMLPSQFVEFHFGTFLSLCPLFFRPSVKCKYVRSIYEADEYIMRYAKTEGCFAILSNDSDFVISEGAEYCLSIKDLDLRSMETYNFNRKNLAKFLKIEENRLPLFASLLKSAEPQEYGKMFTRFEENFLETAERISKWPVIENVEDATKYLKEEEVNEFREKFNSYSSSGPENDVEFSGNATWDNIILAAKEGHVNGVFEKNLLEIIVKRVLFLPPKCSKLQRNPFVTSLRPLRKRTYGIIFFECPDPDVSVREYTFIRKNARESEVDSRFVSVDPHPHPGLLKLWSEDRSRKMVDQRRQLFCKTVNENLTPEILEAANLPEELLFPILTLCYMHWDPDIKLSDFESTVILTQLILATKSLPEIPVLTFQFKVAYLIEKFLKVIEHLQLLNCVCGYPYSSEKGTGKMERKKSNKRKWEVCGCMGLHQAER